MSETALRKFEAQGEVTSLLQRLREFTKPLLITRDNHVEAVLLGIDQYEQLVEGPSADSAEWAGLVIDRAIQETGEETLDEEALEREYERMQQAIWARTEGFSEEEIAEDMAAAMSEVRAEYRVRRIGAGGDYTIVLERSGNQYVTLCLELEVAGIGYTPEGALGNTGLAIESYLEAMEADSLSPERPVPLNVLHEFLAAS